MTSDLEQARRFIPNSIRKAKREKQVDGTQLFGYVSTFVFHGNPEDFHYYDFPNADEAWLRFVATNRSKNLDSSLLPKVLTERLASAEIISGKVANDDTNRVITIYSMGGMGDCNDPDVMKLVLKQLLPERLKDQFCFRTQNAVDCLKFQEVKRYG